MQKFKVDRTALFKVLSGFPGNLSFNLPDVIELEGELLEGGGTAEKLCCSNCNRYPANVHQWKYCLNPGCPCCHKKEKRCLICGHTKEMGKVSRCDSDFHNEEVRLPEMLKFNNNIPDIYHLLDVKSKINEILTYLASKEKK